MESPEQIEALSNERMQEAIILFKNGKYDGAYYLSGYSIELALKAKICRLFGVPNLFTTDEKSINQISGIGEVRKAVKTHNLFSLLIFSGLKQKFDIDKANIKELSLSNSKFFQTWSEDLRYKPCGSINESDCKEILELLQSKTGILKWIATN